MQSTFDRVRRVIVEVLGVSPERITPDTHITDDLDPDSLEQVEIAIGLEKEFDLGLGDEPDALGVARDIVCRVDGELAKREIESRVAV